jgi:REP-associated tyrosine transposase
MPRLPRRWQWTDAACYHLIDRGHNRETVFADDEDRAHFLRLLARYRDRFGFRLYHYCLMGNHFHLLVQLPEARRLSPLMAGLLRSYTHHFHKRHGFVGRLWQGRFKSPAVEAEGYLLSCGRYVERNPLGAGLAAVAWEYRWSSCRAYALGEADPLLAPNPWYEALSPEGGRRQGLWREFLLGDDPKEGAVRESGWAVGGEGFRLRLRQVAGRPAPRRRGRPPGQAGGE